MIIATVEKSRREKKIDGMRLPCTVLLWLNFVVAIGFVVFSSFEFRVAKWPSIILGHLDSSFADR